MNTTLRDGLIVVAGILVLYVLLKPSKKKPEDQQAPESADETAINNKKNAEIALTAYVKAYDDKRDAAFLKNLSNEIIKKYKIRVYLDAKNQRFVATTMKGEEILELK